MSEFTTEQRAAIDCRGNVIVSASAGSGKTTVMIEKLVASVAGGIDLDDVLAVTFTKKAAAQIKEKLRKVLIERIENADDKTRERLKLQLTRIPSSNISTIHALCAKLIRTYFYALDCDSGFDIISSDDAQAKQLADRALDNLFERWYDRDDENFKLVLSCLRKKRSDASVKKLIISVYSAVRCTARYREILINMPLLYTQEGFESVCADLQKVYADRFAALKASVEEFALSFNGGSGAFVYARIFTEIEQAIELAAKSDIFTPLPPLSVTKKPKDDEECAAAGESYKKFRETLLKRYKGVRGELADRDTEREKFFESGKLVKAFASCLLQFDDEYSAVKRDENKLDYNDLEHFTLQLLSDEKTGGEIRQRFALVYVDEYQDVNPVQEEIISALGGEVFMVGDVKQAIYGFRGSKSLYFAEKFFAYEKGGGRALRLSTNFRSTAEVIAFVNKLFSQAMREDTCGFDYAENSLMRHGGLYPEGSGEATVHIFGKEQKEVKDCGVYSVLNDRRAAKHTREGLAVLAVVEKELQSTRYDLESRREVPVQPGDICILTRKNKGYSAEGIVRALTDAGYPVAGAQDANICDCSEVKQMLDILSLIDNGEQDYPLITALLSPLGGFTEDELGIIASAFKGGNRPQTFRECCKKYAVLPGKIAVKLNIFGGQMKKLRSIAQILDASALIDRILLDSGLEARYAAGGGVKLKNVLKLAAEGANLTLSAFLRKIKQGGNFVSPPAVAPSDSITVMTMHASKGLEYPVVIIADVCRSFAGADYAEMPFDEKYGFAAKRYRHDIMTAENTVVRKLVRARSDREEIKNELNLFYVACTRAMCRLHIMAEELKEYSPVNALTAKCYADFFDMSKMCAQIMDDFENLMPQKSIAPVICAVEPDILQFYEGIFMKPYAYEKSVDLPVKSSASAILKMYNNQEPLRFVSRELFGGEGETSVERGIAYHAFLELCDFKIKAAEEIRREIENFVSSGRMSRDRAALLNEQELSEILNMPVFEGLDEAELYREREFLCRMPACDVLDTAATDYVLLQGAIDLLARGRDGWKIIDYKYSGKSDELLVQTYSRQLELYKKAVALITGDSQSVINTAIVNICLRKQIDL